MARHHLRSRHLMEHYRSVLGNRMIDVAYEDVVDDMEGQARKLIGKDGVFDKLFALPNYTVTTHFLGAKRWANVYNLPLFHTQ